MGGPLRSLRTRNTVCVSTFKFLYFRYLADSQNEDPAIPAQPRQLPVYNCTDIVTHLVHTGCTHFHGRCITHSRHPPTCPLRRNQLSGIFLHNHARSHRDTSQIAYVTQPVGSEGVVHAIRARLQNRPGPPRKSKNTESAITHALSELCARNLVGRLAYLVSIFPSSHPGPSCSRSLHLEICLPPESHTLAIASQTLSLAVCVRCLWCRRG